MKSIAKQLILILMIIQGLVAVAQASTSGTKQQSTVEKTTAQPVEMADKMRSEGKIYVVVAVILVVLTGLIVYLFTVDRKLSKLEKQLQEKR